MAAAPAARRGLRYRLEVGLAWALLLGSLAGWPVSLLWWARDEPPFVLSLSWLALVLTAMDLLKTSRVHRDNQGGGGVRGGDGSSGN